MDQKKKAADQSVQFLMGWSGAVTSAQKKREGGPNGGWGRSGSGKGEDCSLSLTVNSCERTGKVRFGGGGEDCFWEGD